MIFEALSLYSQTLVANAFTKLIVYSLPYSLLYFYNTLLAKLYNTGLYVVILLSQNNN